MWNGANWPPTLRPGQMTGAVSPPVGCQKPHPPSPFIIITQPESWYSFYHPTEGRRLSWPRHCITGVQPMPKAVYLTGFYERRATARGGFEPRSSHTAVRHITARPLRCSHAPCSFVGNGCCQAGKGGGGSRSRLRRPGSFIRQGFVTVQSNGHRLIREVEPWPGGPCTSRSRSFSRRGQSSVPCRYIVGFSFELWRSTLLSSRFAHYLHRLHFSCEHTVANTCQLLLKL